MMLEVIVSSIPAGHLIFATPPHTGRHSIELFIYLFLYKNDFTDVCLSVYLFVCWFWEIQTPATILMKFCTHFTTCPRKVLVQVEPPPPLPDWTSGVLNPIS